MTHHTIIIKDRITGESCEKTIPIVPFIGLEIQVQFRANWFAKIEEIQWHDADDKFHVYIERAR